MDPAVCPEAVCNSHDLSLWMDYYHIWIPAAATLDSDSFCPRMSQQQQQIQQILGTSHFPNSEPCVFQSQQLNSNLVFSPLLVYLRSVLWSAFIIAFSCAVSSTTCIYSQNFVLVLFTSLNLLINVFHAFSSV